MLFLFLLITIIISTLIVLFLTKIETLTAILEHAKDIDHAKEERLSFLEDALMEEKIYSSQLEAEMEHVTQIKKELEASTLTLKKLRKQFLYKNKEHKTFSTQQKSALEELRIHYESLDKSHDKADEKYLALKQRYEDLLDEYSHLKNKNNVLELKLGMDEIQKVKKIERGDPHKSEHKEVFAKFTSKIFGGIH